MNTSFPRRPARFRPYLVLLLAVVALGACNLFGEDSNDDGRIVPGQSVDNVRLGADTLQVRSILGLPNLVERGAGYIIYRYMHGRHAGFSIHFGMTEFRQHDGTTSFGLSSPYSGRTREGVGLGSPRSAVLEALGTPDFSSVGSSGFIHDRYESEDARTAFVYDADERVLNITMNGPLSGQ
ncbi:MAG TPA: hypothetical protein VF190_10750 [Rhodothermales bacterium]